MKARNTSTHKKVVARLLDGAAVRGFVNPTAYLKDEGIELLDLEGHLLRISLSEIKGLYFVREFEGNSDRAERKVFLSRPKLNGLWVRMTFKDSEVMDGLITPNLLALNPVGFLVTPPDVFSNNLRIFVPRSALDSMEVLGVITNGARRSPAHLPRRRTATSQMGLFSPATAAESKS